MTAFCRRPGLPATWSRMRRANAWRSTSRRAEPSCGTRPIKYNNPPILHHDQIITDNAAYKLATGERKLSVDPLTGEEMPWSYARGYGCNYNIASEHLLSFRSAAAGFYDLLSEGGTGNLGGFKSGCTSNLIAAAGVLNAPDYTRTCQCSYQNQTSLAFIHMPELEYWTTNDFKWNGKRVRRIGINLNAPGDRVAPDGTLWVDFPSVGGKSPDLPIQFDPAKTRAVRRHALTLQPNGYEWVAASGLAGPLKLKITLVRRTLGHRLVYGKAALCRTGRQEAGRAALQCPASGPRSPARIRHCAGGGRRRQAGRQDVCQNPGEGRSHRRVSACLPRRWSSAVALRHRGHSGKLGQHHIHMQFSGPHRSLRVRGFAFLWVLLLCLAPGAAQEPETISRTLAPVYSPLAEQIVNDFELREKRGTGVDLGSGPGDLIIELCKRTRWMHWVNADIDSRVFAGFLQRAQDAGFRGRVSAMQADAHALPFDDAFAEIVVSRGSYPFWKDKREGLQRSLSGPQTRRGRFHRAGVLREPPSRSGARGQGQAAAERERAGLRCREGGGRTQGDHAVSGD